MHPLSSESLNAGEGLPKFYGKDRLVLMTRDSHCVFAYWELTPQKEAYWQEQIGQDRWSQGVNVLKVNKFSYDENKIQESFHISLKNDSHNWYVHINESDRVYQVELGRLLEGGDFVSMITSNKVKTPRDSLSPLLDPRWGYLDFEGYPFYSRISKNHLSSMELFRHSKIYNHIKKGASD